MAAHFAKGFVPVWFRFGPRDDRLGDGRRGRAVAALLAPEGLAPIVVIGARFEFEFEQSGAAAGAESKRRPLIQQSRNAASSLSAR
jgi:hypothetical protein